MKKILSIFILAVAGILAAQASQTFTVTSVNNSQTIYFRISKTSGSVTRSKTTSNGSGGTVSLTVNDTYWQTFAVTTGSNDYKTITFTLPDDVTYLEVYNNKTNVSAINVTGMATYLTSLNLSGCSNLTSLTLGTMSALTDIDVSNTSAAVANAITAAKCPALENLNVANCGLTSLAYTGTTLYSLDVTGNSIATLNLSGNSNLDMVRCESNSMTSLTVSAAVTTISAQSNSLSTLTGYGEPIQILDVANNGLTTLSMDGLNGLTDLDISSNHLTFRSFPSAEFKPARILYSGNDGQYDFSGSMKAAFGSYNYPLQSKLPNYSSRNESTYTVDLTEARLDGHGVQSVVPVVNSYNGTTDTPLTLATSDVDGNDYAKSTDENLYGFMKPQERVRFSFTNANYPGVTLYSNEFTVPDGVTGTLQIVDEDGTELYSIANAFFSDATDGIPEEAIREYTKYTIPAMPTTAGQTWRITAGPSDDAPFAWAKTYGSATWYYMSLGTGTNKWATAGESNGSPGTAYGGHALKNSYSTSDNYYQWAFVGNQYDGFKIYNKGCGDGQTLQDYSGYFTPTSGGLYPIMRNGTSLTWIVRTNSSGTGFSLENKTGGTDGGVSKPCFLNNFAGNGYMNYWISDDAQNDPGSRFTVVKASDPISATVKWVIVDGSNNPIYSIIQDVTSGATISSYPTELTTMASQRFVTLPTLTSFTAGSGQTVKNVSYTWTGPFQISTTGNEHHYQLKIRNALYITSNTMSGGQLDCTTSAEVTNDQRWMFFGDPFNGFILRNYAKNNQALAAANGTATNGSSYPTFESEGTRWIITTCTQAGYTNPFSVAPAGTTGVYWNQYGGVDNNQGLKYWSANGTSDGGAAVQAILIEDVITEVPITWIVVDGNGNEMISTTVNHTYGSTVSSYPTALTDFAEYFVSYPDLSSFIVNEPKEIQVTYLWDGPFQFTTDTDKHLYRISNTYYGNLYTSKDNNQRVHCNSTSSSTSGRCVWMFKGNPFDGIQVISYYDETTGLNNGFTGYGSRSSSPTTYYIRKGDASGRILFADAFGSDDVLVSYPYLSGEDNVIWHNAGGKTQWNGQFTLTEVDKATIVLPGYYKLRCVNEALATKYITMTTNGIVQNTSDNVNGIDKAFFLDEQEDFTWLVSHSINDTPYYLDNTCTATNDNTVTTTTDVSNAQACVITYDNKQNGIPFFRIKAGTYASYDGYTYLNINTSQSGVFLWNYTSGTADGSAWALEPVARVKLNTVGDKSYATFYFDRDVQTDANTKAYYITTATGSYATLTEVANEGRDIPANTAVVLINSEQDNYAIFDVTSGLSPVVSEDDNLLKGTLVSMSLDLSDETPYYSLGRKDDIIGFYKFQNGNTTTITLGANKAYLDTPTSGGAVKGFRFGFGDEDGIDAIENAQSTMDNVQIYNLAGQRLSKPRKGVNIINGKKVIIK